MSRRPVTISRDERPEGSGHPASLPDETLLAQCVQGRGKSGGPGGQHRNKVETMVELTHKPSGMQAHAGERRSVSENRQVAIRRLRLLLATEHRQTVPLGEIGSALWRSRVQGGRIVCNPDHSDYPSLLAEAMDVLFAMKLDPQKAAIRLGCTASQLIKLLREHPPALLRVNEARAERGEHPIK
ncbi:MAG: hypothetical protein KF838_01185 [Phycisphaeraceae bacterium]|nr:MAG: hypothetical protein KF838_01185 [Phycisphaeraceae bacterium]